MSEHPLTDAMIAQYWPDFDPADIRRQFDTMTAALERAQGAAPASPLYSQRAGRGWRPGAVAALPADLGALAQSLRDAGQEALARTPERAALRLKDADAILRDFVASLAIVGEGPIATAVKSALEGRARAYLAEAE
jgi:hypothetical protein